jgi:hypothetical protein
MEVGCDYRYTDKADELTEYVEQLYKDYGEDLIEWKVSSVHWNSGVRHFIWFTYKNRKIEV